MKQWYRKTIAKVIVLLAGVLCGAAFITSLGVVVTYAGTADPAQIIGMANEPYEESEDFNTSVENSIFEVFDMFRLTDIFETDGVYAPSKAIDIMQYNAEGGTGRNQESGITYTLENLIEWGGEFTSSEGDVYNNNVIVCQREDGSYYYYYLDEFLALCESGGLVFQFDDAYQSQASFLNELADGEHNGSDGGESMRILGSDGDVLYTDCWNFGSAVNERYAPAGEESLLQAVNSRPELNGKLSDIYDSLAMLLGNIYDDYWTYDAGWEYLEEGNTNFTYLYVDRTKKQLYTNKAEYDDYSRAETSIDEMKSGHNAKYIVVYPKLKDFETNMSISESGEWNLVRSNETNRNSENILAVSVDTSYPIKDMFYEGSTNYSKNVPFLRGSLIQFAAGGLLLLIAIVWLTVTAGRKPDDETVHLTGFDHWKTEIAAALVIGVWVIVTLVFIGGAVTFGWDVHGAYQTEEISSIPVEYSSVFTAALRLSDLVLVYLYGMFSFLCFFAGYTSLVRRIKAKSLWKDSLIRMVICGAGQIWQERTVTVRAGAGAAAYLCVQWLAILFRTGPFVLLAAAADVWILWVVFGGAIAKHRIKKGIEEIAGGNLEYRINLEWFRGEDRELAEKVNNIGSGLNRAVDEAMRNERLKTDLITNVSHDIKTPLTSIINYVDILKRSDISDEKIRGYLDILEAKAQRLKTLTEDVVEASKVSSGNISLEYMDMDLRELVQQSEGEMAEKFAARDLTMVLNIPEEPAVIHVDGRRMWRVLENIFGNAAKYAMPGTRVYADLMVSEDKVEFSLKNISEQQLNISADELTERFIRGDISRSTEGSGLGLSIAKSLTTMQGGEFELYLDGDLFRVNIRFARIK